jgi:hypothetical protein
MKKLIDCLLVVMLFFFQPLTVDGERFIHTDEKHQIISSPNENFLADGVLRKLIEDVDSKKSKIYIEYYYQKVPANILLRNMPAASKVLDSVYTFGYGTYSHGIAVFEEYKDKIIKLKNVKLEKVSINGFAAREWFIYFFKLYNHEGYNNEVLYIVEIADESIEITKQNVKNKRYTTVFFKYNKEFKNIMSELIPNYEAIQQKYEQDKVRTRL